jgi:hypothetical protein
MKAYFFVEASTDSFSSPSISANVKATDDSGITTLNLLRVRHQLHIIVSMKCTLGEIWSMCHR